MRIRRSAKPVLFALAFSLLPQCRSAGDLNESTRMVQVTALGKRLFFEPRLSGDGTLACASCHQPEHAFTNGLPSGVGIRHQIGDRNVPTLISRAGSTLQFWDGRARTLEEQIGMVLTSPREMGAASVEAAAENLNSIPEWSRDFQMVFHGPATADRIRAGLAAYIRSLSPGVAPYDRYLAGDKTALTESQIRGRHLFFEKFKCSACHTGANFTDEKLRPRCYPATNNLREFIPIRITADKLFKTPTLRNLIYTGPYMHDGNLTTLEEVVDFYNPSFQVDDKGEPDFKRPVTRISDRERKDLVAFLKSLSAPVPYEERAALGK